MVKQCGNTNTYDVRGETYISLGLIKCRCEYQSLTDESDCKIDGLITQYSPGEICSSVYQSQLYTNSICEI